MRKQQLTSTKFESDLAREYSKIYGSTVHASYKPSAEKGSKYVEVYFCDSTAKFLPEFGTFAIAI